MKIKFLKAYRIFGEDFIRSMQEFWWKTEVGKPVIILHIDRRNKDSSFILEGGFGGIIIVKMILFGFSLAHLFHRHYVNTVAINFSENKFWLCWVGRAKKKKTISLQMKINFLLREEIAISVWRPRYSVKEITN